MGQKHSSRIMFLTTLLEHSPIFLFGVLDLCLPLDDPCASTNRALYSGDENYFRFFTADIFRGNRYLQNRNN